MSSGALLYPFSLGLVASANPCGFPLLPAYLSYFVANSSDRGWISRTASGLATGAAVTAGFVAVFASLGILFESGVRLVVSWVPWVMVPFGAALALFGILELWGKHPRVPLPALGMRRGGGGLAVVAFGAAYAVASLSCALPLFLAGVAGSFTRSGALAGVGDFVSYGLGMGLFLTVASLAAAHARLSALRSIRPLTRFVPRLAGGILAAVGAYLVLYWVSDLVDPLSTPAPVRAVDSLQSAISGWLAGSPRLLGLAGAVIVVGALAMIALCSRRQSASPDGSASLPSSASKENAGVPN